MVWEGITTNTAVEEARRVGVLAHWAEVEDWRMYECHVGCLYRHDVPQYDLPCLCSRNRFASSRLLR
jgi:hypothetical protein